MLTIYAKKLSGFFFDIIRLKTWTEVTQQTAIKIIGINASEKNYHETHQGIHSSSPYKIFSRKN